MKRSKKTASQPTDRKTIQPIDIVISPTALFLIAWLLMMISIPIIGWVGDAYFEAGVMLGVLLQACTVITILQQAWGTAQVVKLISLIVPITWLLEFNGSQTGIPFGKYHYTDILQPQIGGVPLIIPVAWLMMLPVSWGVAAAILRGGEGKEKGQQNHAKAISSHYALKFSLLSGLAMTAWDLFLDPQMVGWGYWVWDQPGSYFGIPLVNFVGWWVCSALITRAMLYIIDPQILPTKPLVMIYAIVWALQSVGQALFWSQPGPAAFGFIGMGIPLWVALFQLRHSKQASLQPS